jgi:hypothetical protein
MTGASIRFELSSGFHVEIIIPLSLTAGDTGLDRRALGHRLNPPLHEFDACVLPICQGDRP